MADDMTPGEVRRTLERIEQGQKDAHRAIDDRISELARKAVPAELHAAEYRALGEDVRHLEADMHESVALIERTSQERMTTLRGEIAVVRKAQADHLKTHQDDRSWSRSKRLTVLAIAVGAAATLIGAYIAAFAAAGGVR